MGDPADMPEARETWARRVRRRLLRAVLGLLAAALLLTAALAALLPTVLPLLSFDERTFDLGPRLPEGARQLVAQTTATVDFGFARAKGRAGGLTLRARGRLLDWPYALRSDFDYSLWRRTAAGTFALTFDGTPWRVDGRFAASPAGWALDAQTPPTAFDAEDPLLGAVLARAAAPAATNLVFSGKLGLAARAATTNGLALPTWSAQAALSDFSAAFAAGEGRPVAVERLRVRAGVRGLGPHVDVDPLFPRAEALAFAGLEMTNVFASVRATENAYLVTEAGADFCGGQARLYALFLNPERLSAGFTLFLDDVDAGRALNCLAGFRGSATGRLHGKLPLRLRDGRRLSFGDAYLYSVPGETGTLRLADPGPVLENLAMGGVSAADRENLAKALQDLSYTALNIQLRREADASDVHALTLKLQGSATHGNTTVPVSFAVTLRGDLEQLVNTGILLPQIGRKP